MPYINQKARQELNEWYRSPDSPGELNYVITRAVLTYLDKTDLSYTAYNAVIGVLECVKQELYRRSMGPYEERKMKENGDVY